MCASDPLSVRCGACADRFRVERVNQTLHAEQISPSFGRLPQMFQSFFCFYFLLIAGCFPIVSVPELGTERLLDVCPQLLFI